MIQLNEIKLLKFTYLLLILVFTQIESQASLSLHDSFETDGRGNFTQSSSLTTSSKMFKSLSKQVAMVIEDEVSLNLSSVKKKKEEMVFYSYTNKKIDKKKEEAQIKEPKVPQLKEKIVKIKNANNQSKKNIRHKKLKQFIDYSQFIQSSYKKKKSGTLSVQLIPISKNGKSKSTLSDFDFVPQYDLNEIYTDSGTGTISIPVSSEGREYSTLRGSLASKNIIRTNFEMSVQKDLLISIPVFEIDTFEQILEKEKIREEYGSHLLVDLSDSVDSSIIEGKYKKKLYLNHKFQQVDEGSEYRYELYLDVEPGNHLIRYMDFKGRIAEKIIHIVQGEVSYEEPNLVSESYSTVNLFEENIVSKKLGQKIEEAKNINYFNSNITSQKVGLNRYKVKVPLREAAFRKYLRIGDESVFYIGYDQDGDLILPSDEYTNYIKSIFGENENSNSCIIQMNLHKPLKEFKAYVTSDKPSGSYRIYYMDKDGSFSDELTGLSEKVFIISSDFGVINAKLKYTGNKIRYLQSFCTESLYLVEQL